MSPGGRGLVRDNSLSLAFLAVFLLALLGQAIAGHRDHNAEQRDHGEPQISLVRYVTSSHFGVETAENWQSEFLQFALYIVATTWLVQRGSSESKRPGDEGTGERRRAQPGGGVRAALYSNSLVLAFGGIFITSWTAQSVTGWRAYNEEQLEHGAPGVSWAGYLERPDFWDRTFQNWQSEFLAVGTMAVFAVYLRQRGSPESKPVDAADEETTSNG